MSVSLLSLAALLLAAAVVVIHLAPGVVFQWVTALSARRAAGLELKEVSVDGHRIAYRPAGAAKRCCSDGFAANKDHWAMIAPSPTLHLFVSSRPTCRASAYRAAWLYAASYGATAQLERIAAFARAVGVDNFHLGDFDGRLSRHPARLALSRAGAEPVAAGRPACSAPSTATCCACSKAAKPLRRLI